MVAPGVKDESFEKLKALLLGEDARRLGDVEEGFKRIDRYVGDRPKLETAVADLLVDALRKAEVAHHKELAGALAPLIVAAIRSEIKNSKEMMVEALYPITGRLVTAAVANSFRELVEDLNRRIDAMVSTNVWRLRFRALATGRSMAEVAMAEADAASLRRALLLERGSGRVLATWPEALDGGDHGELTSGLIAAITEFAATVYADRGGELRMLDLGSSHVFLRASARVIVAAEFSGELSSTRARRLDEAFLRIVEAHEKDESSTNPEALSAELGEALKEDPAKPTSKGPLIAVATGLAALIAWLAYEPTLRAWRDYRIDKAYAAAYAADRSLAEYPLRLEVDHQGGRVVLHGLAANENEPQRVLDAIAPAAAPYRVERDVVVLAPASALAESQRLIAQLQDELTQTRAALERLNAQTENPSVRLHRLIENFAVFFTKQDNLADPAAAVAGLDELAKLLVSAGEGLRVVGYSDESGSAITNSAVSRARADKVISMLVERGVPREKLALVPRSTLAPIADSSLGVGRSRRVVFEQPYDHEFDIR
jgi:outer membrane protein OmpA-like peptidoglycan-associated protein